MAKIVQLRLPTTLEFSSVTNLKDEVKKTDDLGYTHMIIQIANDHFKREFFAGKARDRKGPYTRSDLNLTASDWKYVIGRPSMYIDCDSTNKHFRRSSEETLMQELDYACHVGMHAFIVPLRGLSAVNLTRILISKLVPTTAIEIWFKIPLVSYKQMAKLYLKKADSNAEPSEEDDSWNWWNMVRSLAKSNSRVCLALELTDDLPGEVGDIEVSRWLGEPIRALVLPTRLFVLNAKGFPVLARRHHLFLVAVARACPMGVNYIVTGACHHKSYDLYRKYIEFVVERVRGEVDDKYPFYAKAYPDVLQYPFQPIAHEMDSQTYDVFEKDHVKYGKYQEAIYQAVMDRVSKEEVATKVQVIWVLGAGRGPLVSAALNAGLKAKARVRVFAVEKNQNCVLTLKKRLIEGWRGFDVTVIHGDMRDCRPDEADLADIVVSELLGSFGDDNLAPELLNGSHHIFKGEILM
ncbi:protein arginine N-methyltransferase 5-like [Nilaparvata lugens]|uniref:protein arginine N-methyltransferase 5-like n=1 Tax=Nilaparvata lugens TaxID=108931 RepID=UPI00193D1CE4|nr:protein arginine N-methyltransferase 5-like [Nilaparvata lugens]